MRKKISVNFALVLMLVAVLVTFQVTYLMVNNSYSRKYNEITANYSAFEKLLSIDSIVRSNYVGDIDDGELSDILSEAYIYGIGDKYGRYLNEEELGTLISGTSGNSIGIGVQVIYDSEINALEIVNISPGSPAQEAGIMVGDLIVSVSGSSVSDIGYEEAMTRMRGEEGTVAEFTVIRNDSETIDFSVTRARVTDVSVLYHLYADASGVNTNIGIIKITGFNNKTPEQFKAAVEDLKTKGADRFVFDVRYNLGGELNSITETLDYILPEGPIVRVVEASGNENVIYSDSEFMDSKMVVMINGYTASAAELFSCALKDYAANGSLDAYLIGETTYGKGTMQNVIALGDGSAISISTNLYNPPYSDNYEGVGVKPDMEVSLSEAAKSVNIYKLSDFEDDQLQAAISYLCAE